MAVMYAEKQKWDQAKANYELCVHFEPAHANAWNLSIYLSIHLSPSVSMYIIYIYIYIYIYICTYLYYDILYDSISHYTVYAMDIRYAPSLYAGTTWV